MRAKCRHVMVRDVADDDDGSLLESDGGWWQLRVVGYIYVHMLY